MSAEETPPCGRCHRSVRRGGAERARNHHQYGDRGIFLYAYEHGRELRDPLPDPRHVQAAGGAYDAQYGHTGGGVISLSIKPGTNKFHGAGYEYMRRAAFNADQFVANASGQARTNNLADQYGIELDGPVLIPKVYKGRGRTFFMFSWESYRDVLPNPVLQTLPTQLERNGDFSQSFNSSKKLYTIYDPQTIRPNPAFDPAKAVSLSNLQYLRTPFAGNLVPQARMSPITLNLINAALPLRNQPGDATTHANNWVGTNAAEDNAFVNLIGRIDHTINSTWKIFGRGDHNQRELHRDSRFQWLTADSPVVYSGRRNDGAMADVVSTLSPSTVVDAKIGFTRYDYTVNFPSYDVASLGFPKTLLSQLQLPNKFPALSFEGYQSTDNERWAPPRFRCCLGNPFDPLVPHRLHGESTSNKPRSRHRYGLVIYCTWLTAPGRQ